MKITPWSPNETEEETKAVIVEFLRRAGPSTEATIAAYMDVRADLGIASALLELLEAGEFEADRSDDGEFIYRRKCP